MVKAKKQVMYEITLLKKNNASSFKEENNKMPQVLDTFL